MKNYRLLMLFVATTLCLMLQAQKKSEFMFEDYQDAVVHFKGLLRSNEKVNYHFASNTFYFVDKKDDRVKVLDNLDNIIIIKIGDREFIPEKDVMLEMLPTTPLIYVQYNAKTIQKAPKGAFSMTQEGASVSTYTEFRDGGTHNKLKAHDQEVKEYYNYYWIEKNNKKKVFKDFKQFLKLYPKHKTVLQEYIKENNVDFLDVKAIVDMCLYAESL